MTSATVIVGTLVLLTLLAWIFPRREDPTCPICFEGRLLRVNPGKRQCDVCRRHFRRTDIVRRVELGTYTQGLRLGIHTPSRAEAKWNS